MALDRGTRVGDYQIISAMGAGGMGEVYRAHDTRLKRDVALKVLPVSVAADPGRVARFEREAELLAALDHPNIASIYSVEQVEHSLALVMELVEGEDLSERIARGPIPADEALPIARQIADALEAAHDRGIIHRDLKPANIKLRPDGTVKVLDFGLAKESQPEAVTNSPTITSPAMTAAGVILGTAAYMSPEQARGRTVDRRADVWAFGVVLFEMLTGTRAFAGDDVTETLASVLRSEPEWSRLPTDVPEAVTTLLRRCLDKDPRTRLSHLSVATFLLRERTTDASPLASSVAQRRQDRRRLVAMGVVTALAAAIASGVTWWLVVRTSQAPAAGPIRFTIAAATGGETWAITTDRPLALSPDGRTLAFRASGDGVPRLFIRRLDTLQPRMIDNTELPRAPFFSPDGQWVGFFLGAELKKVRISGGPVVTIARAGSAGGLVAGASWGDDDEIVYAIRQPNTTAGVSGLMIVPASGGEPKALTTIDPERGETSHDYPFVLPGSRAVLFKVQLAGRAAADGPLVVLDRTSGQRREISPTGSAAEYLNGHVVYSDQSGRLHSLPFDLTRLEPSGPATPLPETVHVPPVGQPLFSTAAAGGLAFVPGDRTDLERARTLVWVNRQGHEAAIDAPPRMYAMARLSPDESQIVLDIRDQENDIWTWSTGRAALTRLTRGATLDMAPIWSADGRRIIWTSTRDSTNPVLFWQAADGTGAPDRLAVQGLAQFPGAATPDGKALLFYQGGNIRTAAIYRLLLDGDRRVETVLSGSGVLTTPEVSPDGRWMAYSSDESGQPEVYVRPYPNVDGGRWQISSRGGSRPAWSRSARELFFLDGASHLSVAAMSMNGDTLAPGPARRLLERPYYPGFTTRGLPLRGYDVSADGTRFLMIKGDARTESQSEVHVTLNWSPVP
jgi:serine/threonine-protein kinase